MQATLTLEEASTTLTAEGTPPTTIPELQCPPGHAPYHPTAGSWGTPPAHFRLLAGRQAMEAQEMPAHHSLRERAQVRVPAPRLQGPQLGHPWAPQVGTREHRTSPAGILSTKEGVLQGEEGTPKGCRFGVGAGGSEKPSESQHPHHKNKHRILGTRLREPHACNSGPQSGGRPPEVKLHVGSWQTLGSFSGHPPPAPTFRKARFP